MDPALRALGKVDFQWTTHIDSVWRELPFDVPQLQHDTRRWLSERLHALAETRTDASPLGVPLLGPAGAGKTHLLHALRKDAQSQGLFFVLVDMTDVHDFKETVLLGTLRSLGQSDAGGRPQYSRLLEGLIEKYGDELLRQDGVTGFSVASYTTLISNCRRLIRGLQLKHENEGREYRDVVRALVLLASGDPDIGDLGYGWLQGAGIQLEDAKHFDFSQEQQHPSHIFRGLSWLMSLVSPTVLALDQLDAIVAELNLANSGEEDEQPAARQKLSKAIIQGIAGGLIALRDATRKTQIVVSCLESTWSYLDERPLVSMRDRFEPAVTLKPLASADTVRQLVELRLASAYKAVDYLPPYQSYPYAAGFFAELMGASPREVLKRCEKHRQECMLAQRMIEIHSDRAESAQPAPQPAIAELSSRFADLRQKSRVQELLANQDEEALDKLVETACKCLVEETELPEQVDSEIDFDFMGSGPYEPLHARLRLIYRNEGDRERHYAFRFVQKQHHRSFQARLKAAITASGIDRDLGFRRLAVLRVGEPPQGPASRMLVEDLKQRNGLLLEPAISELDTLWALQQMFGDPDLSGSLNTWLRHERPVSRLPLFRDAVDWLNVKRAPLSGPSELCQGIEVAPAEDNALPRVPHQRPMSNPPGKSSKASVLGGGLPVGRRLVGGCLDTPISIPLANLRKHTVVLAGSGSGKTVLLKRLVEESVLAGVPAIVIDGANDLSLLGDCWPAPPDRWVPQDREKARDYCERVDAIVWTPGIQKGRPFTLNPIPDFAAVRDDTDELNSAIDMAVDSLAPIAAHGNKESDRIKRAILRRALECFSHRNSHSLSDFRVLLHNLPSECASGFQRGAELGAQMSESLLAAMTMDPLLCGDGAALDPGCLLNSDQPAKVRVSVVNLSRLSGERGQQLVDQLTMALFSYIKRHPAKDASPTGLLVVDEAKDFVPSGKSVRGKDNMIRLVAQARKYGLGVVFATQAPKSIDHNIIANCATQFYGRANSPAAIDTVREQIRLRGGSGDDIPNLQPGVFYMHTDGMEAPCKVSTPMCLSWHPASPPDELGVLKRARKEREEELVTG